MRRTYENGYWNKIDYWVSKLKEAVEKQDLVMVKKSIEKIEYFQQRQEEVYG
jgi:hypothetical protein